MSIDDLILASERERKNGLSILLAAWLAESRAEMQRLAPACACRGLFSLADAQHGSVECTQPSALGWAYAPAAPPQWAFKHLAGLPPPDPTLGAKDRTCPECYARVGHYSTCRGKGYGSVGPHPQSPDYAAAEPSTERAPTGKCECGVTVTGVGGLHSSWCPAGGGV